ncbi:MAG: MmgE/PrpD family protein [Lachnospiraceae bacterium]|nr:MmgE/PrpD family protein [Lachnospiraceae bacterium]
MRYNRLYKETDYVPSTDYTGELARYLVNLKYEDLPDEVVTRAKYILLQTVGAALAAKGTDIARKADVLAVEANNGLGGSVTRWLEGGKISPANAALLAGVLTDALDWEDCSWTGHPSAGIIPVAIIAAEEKGKSGKDLITAIVGAYEVYQRIANAVQPADHSKGWGLTSWQLFGTVAAAAKLYDLSAEQVERAIGIAAEASTIPACYHEATMSDFYHFEHGYRARDGILIAKQAGLGINNARCALDDVRPSGYLASITSAPKIEWLVKDLGTRYLIMETLLKHWPANMWVQSPLEALKDITDNHSFEPDDIASIEVDPPVTDRMWLSEDGYTSITHAEFSVPFALAAFLKNPTPGASWYSKENLKDKEVLKIASKVKGGSQKPIGPGEGFSMFLNGDYPVRKITVTLKNGEVVSGSSGKHPGHPHNMFTEEEISSRFLIQAAPSLSEDRAKDALKVFLNIEDYTASDLVPFLA